MTRSWFAFVAGTVAPLLVLLAYQPLAAQEADLSQADSVSQSASAPMPAAEVDAALQEAREFLKTGDYDRAIDVLKASIQAGGQEPAAQREAYLLLIKTYVFLGNDLKFKPQGREAANLNYKEARSLIGECLSIPELRRTRPEPATDYPPEMLDLFTAVRGEMFGSFRIVGLEPVDALATLDADTLSVLPGESNLSNTDLPVGRHRVLVCRSGYKDLEEEITISPNSTLERSYTLEKKHGKGWYAAIGSGVAVAAGAAVAIVAASGSTESTAQPLPGPPGPPNR